jgi:hypothetical protein
LALQVVTLFLDYLVGSDSINQAEFVRPYRTFSMGYSNIAGVLQRLEAHAGAKISVLPDEYDDQRPRII